MMNKKNNKKQILLALVGILTIATSAPLMSNKLFDAVHNGNISEVERLVKDPTTDVNQAIKDGWTPLHEAASNGKTEIVKLLLTHKNIHGKYDININIATTDSDTSLLRNAIAHGDELQSTCTNPISCISSLHYAKSKEHNYSSIVLLQCLDECMLNPIGSTALHLAALKGHTAIVEALIKRPEINIDRLDDDKNTPLQNAAFSGHLDIVTLLLENGADVNGADERCTTLQEAVCEGHLPIVKKLLEQKSIAINAINNYGYTALHFAVEKEDHQETRLEIVKALLEHPKIEVNIENENGDTPLSIAIAKEALAVVKELLKNPTIKVNGKEIDVNNENEQKKPLLMVAMSYDPDTVKTGPKTKLAIVKALLEHPKIDVNIRYNGNTPLLQILYVQLWSKNVLRLKFFENAIMELLKHPNIDVNIKATTTPLSLTLQGLLIHDEESRIVFEHITAALLKHPKIEIDKQDDIHETPLSRALDWVNDLTYHRGHYIMTYALIKSSVARSVERLLAHGADTTGVNDEKNKYSKNIIFRGTDLYNSYEQLIRCTTDRKSSDAQLRDKIRKNPWEYMVFINPLCENLRYILVEEQNVASIMIDGLPLPAAMHDLSILPRLFELKPELYQYLIALKKGTCTWDELEKQISNDEHHVIYIENKIDPNNNFAITTSNSKESCLAIIKYILMKRRYDPKFKEALADFLLGAGQLYKMPQQQPKQKNAMSFVPLVTIAKTQSCNPSEDSANKTCSNTDNTKSGDITNFTDNAGIIRSFM